MEQKAHAKAMFRVYSTKYTNMLPLIKVNSILRMKSRSDGDKIIDHDNICNGSQASTKYLYTIANPTHPSKHYVVSE